MSRPHPALLPLAAGRTTTGVPATDDGLLVSAIHHGMHGLLWTWVRDHEPGYSELVQLAALDVATRQRHGRLWDVLGTARATLKAIDVDVAVVKGVPAEARWYARMGERPCTDIDLLVDPSEVHRAGEIVAVFDAAHPLRHEIGNLVREHAMQSVHLSVDGISVDVHFDLLKLGFPMRQRDVVWDRMRDLTTPDGSVIRVPDAETSLVLFLVHANKDSFFRLLAYADVARVLAAEQLDWAFVERFLHAEGLDTVGACALTTVTRALGLPGTPLDDRDDGVRACLWRAVWPEAVTLLGSAGPARSRRQECLPFLVRGRLRGALRSAWLVMFPHGANLALRYPDIAGPYLWRLARGRSRTWRTRRVALRARHSR